MIHLPGIPGYKCPVAHFFTCKQISYVAQLLNLPVSTRVIKRLFWILFLVSRGDVSQDFLGFFEFSFQQQISCRFRSKPTSKNARGNSTKFYAGWLRPEVQHFNLLHTIFDTEKVPLSHTFH